MDFAPDVGSNDLVAIGDGLTFQMALGTVQPNNLKWSDTRVFMHYQSEIGGTTTGFSTFVWPYRHQFQTLDGYGYLLASDSFRVSGRSVGQAAAVSFSWKLYYRFVDIPLSEFIGIVQSTQAT